MNRIALLLTLIASLFYRQARAAVDWAHFLSQCDPVWQRMPSNYYEGPFVGNGIVGTIFYKDEKLPRTIRFEIGRTDVYDHRIGGSSLHERVRLPIGQILLTTSGEIQQAAFRTDLWNAEVTGTIATTSGTLSLRCFAPSQHEVVILDLRASGEERAAKLALRPQRGDSPRFLAQPGRDKNYIYKENPEPELKTLDGVQVAVQPLLAGGDYATAWSDTAGADGARTVIWTTAYCWAANKHPLAGSAGDAIATLHAAQSEGVPAMEVAHRQWWHRYYQASFVTVPDPRIESFYWIQLYKLASATRGDRPVVDLMGPWFKITVWAAYWQNLNTELPYYLPDVINHPELSEAPSRLIETHASDLIANVPPEWRSDSAALGNPTGYNSLAAPAPGPPALTPGQAYHFIALPWLMQQFYLHSRFTADDARLRDPIYPLLKRAMNPYLHTLFTGTDGKYHIPNSFSDEYGNAEDTNLNLALLRWGLKTLMTTSERLQIPEPDRARWNDVLAKLAPFQIDPATGFMIGKDVPFAKSHRHYSHLFAVFPLFVITPEQNPEMVPIIEQSLRHFTGLVGDECLFKFTGAASLWAALGNGDEALRWLNRALTIQAKGPTITPNTLYSENGWPTFESPISAARSLTDMLIQSHGGVIRVFPAMPAAWPDAAFENLRAEGGFLVSAIRSHGTTAYVHIHSLAGEPCRVRIDGQTRELHLAAGEDWYLGARDTEIEPLPVDPPNAWGAKLAVE